MTPADKPDRQKVESIVAMLQKRAEIDCSPSVLVSTRSETLAWQAAALLTSLMSALEAERGRNAEMRKTIMDHIVWLDEQNCFQRRPYDVKPDREMTAFLIGGSHWMMKVWGAIRRGEFNKPERDTSRACDQPLSALQDGTT